MKKKIKDFFGRVKSFLKKYLGLFVAILFILVSATFYKSISVLNAKMISLILDKYGLFDGGVRVYIVLTFLSLLMVFFYFYYDINILNFLKYFKIGIDSLEKKERKTFKLKTITVYASIILFFLSVPAVFIIYFRVIFEEVGKVWLIILFLISSIISSILTILGACLLKSSPYIFYSIILFLIIITMIKKIKNKLKEHKIRI